MSEDRWVLNANEGVDTIHRNPREECNTDQATGRKAVDEFTAEAMLNAGDAVPCKHCLKSWPS